MIDCPLTRKQLGVLTMIAVEGLTVDQIAARLGSSPSTIRSHLHAANRHLGVVNQTQAVLACVCEGWITVPGLGTSDTLMLARIDRLLGQLVDAIQRREDRPISDSQRGYLEAFLSWLRSREDEDGPCRRLALERLRFVLSEANPV